MPHYSFEMRGRAGFSIAKWAWPAISIIVPSAAPELDYRLRIGILVTGLMIGVVLILRDAMPEPFQSRAARIVLAVLWTLLMLTLIYGVERKVLSEAAGAARSLSTTQSSALRDNLSSLVGHKIYLTSDLSDAESGRYAQQFVALFQSIGIEIGPTQIQKSVFSTPPPPLSINCYTSQPVNAALPEVQDALILRRAFIAAGLVGNDLRVQVIPRHDLFGRTHFAEIVVGPKETQ